MHAWTFLKCLNFWTDWQWVENTRKSGSCAIPIHLRSELRTQLPLWPLLLWAQSTPQLQDLSFSVYFYRNHMETVKTLAKNELWCTWKALWIISAKSCTFINQSWNLAGCRGLVTHCTQGSAPNPSLTGSPSVHSSRLWEMLDWQLAQDLFSMHDRGTIHPWRY